MSKLRDVELRWSRDEQGPEWFAKNKSVEYLFYKGLRALKIETPGFVKINIYCEPEARPYTGAVFDGVTDVEVDGAWPDERTLSPQLLKELFLQRLLQGVTIVCATFGLPCEGIEALARELRASECTLELWLGKAVPSPDGVHTARARLRAAASLEHCVVEAVISRGRQVMVQRPLCTTFPAPDHAVDSFRSLEWSAPDRLRAVFEVYGSRGAMRFGRENFDASGFDGVVAQREPSSRELRIEADVGAWVRQG